MKIFSPIIIGLLLLVQNANGQKLLDLKECIKIGQQNSIAIKQALLSEKDAQIGVKYSKSSQLPNLEGNSNLSYNIGRRVNPTTNTYISESFLSQSYSLSSGMLLFNGKKLRNNISKALTDKKMSEENTNQIERDIALLVTNYYLLILYAEENLINSENQYNSTKEQLERTMKLVNAGSKPQSASLNLEAQLLADEQKKISRQNELDKAYLDLKNLLQINENDNIKIQHPDINSLFTSKNTVYSLSELIQKSLQHQPEMKVAEYRIQSAEIAKKISSASLFPTLGLYGGLSTDYVNKALEITGYNKTYSYTDFMINDQVINVGVPVDIPITKSKSYYDQLKNNFGFGAALQLRVPIYDNYSTGYSIQKAKLNIESAKLQKEQTIQDIKAKIQTALADYKAAKAQYEAADKSLAAQKNAFDATKIQYEIGAAGIYDFLNAKNLFEQTQNTLLLTKYDLVFKTKILDFYLGENLDF